MAITAILLLGTFALGNNVDAFAELGVIETIPA